MNAITIIFMTIATVFALATLAYVIIDIILEMRSKKSAEVQAPEAGEEEPAKK